MLTLSPRLSLSSQPATGLSALLPRSGLERSDFVLWPKCEVPRCPLYFRNCMKIRSETDMPNSVNRAVGCAYNAVRLSSASPAERFFLQRAHDGSAVVD